MTIHRKNLARPGFVCPQPGTASLKPNCFGGTIILILVPGLEGGFRGSMVRGLMPQNYVPVLLFAAVIGVLIPAALLASKIRRAQNFDPPMPPSEPANTGRQGRTRWYIFATMFVVFEAEAGFLFPWAVKFKSFDRFGRVEMLISLVVLVVGYIWIWRKGALKWL